MKLSPLRIFSLDSSAGTKMGIVTGKSRNGKSNVFPSEYITMLDMNEPANEMSTAPTKRIGSRSKKLAKEILRKAVDKGTSAKITKSIIINE